MGVPKKGGSTSKKSDDNDKSSNFGVSCVETDHDRPFFLQGLTGLFSPPVLALFDRIQSVYINELLNRNQSHPMSGLPNWLQQV